MKLNKSTGFKVSVLWRQECRISYENSNLEGDEVEAVRDVLGGADEDVAVVARLHDVRGGATESTINSVT